jgi:hypothetical protein
MEAETVHDSATLQARHAEAREKLEELLGALRAVDAELEALSDQRQQHLALKQVCDGLDSLAALGGAALFWNDCEPPHGVTRHQAGARGRLAAFEQRVSDIEQRREALRAAIREQERLAYVLEDDVFEAQEEEERRRLEWIVEREIGSVASRSLQMPWARGGEDDRRFRKTLATSLLVSLLFALLLPLIDIPLPPPVAQVVELPERAVRMIIKQPPPLPSPPVPETVPPPEQRIVERKPIEKPVEAVVEEIEEVVEQPEAPAPKGILAFRERLAGLKETQVVARLGSQARINDADISATRTERSMLTSNAPGSSGGINLAALSRDAGQGGGGESLQGVAVTKATSNIKSSGGTDRPLSSGPGAARTDEEIQIVFDRYKASLYRLYNRELRKDPALRGQMVLRLTIEPNGSVSMCALQASDMNAPELSAQIVDRVRTINFGAKDVSAITILYPIDFLPAA